MTIAKFHVKSIMPPPPPLGMIRQKYPGTDRIKTIILIIFVFKLSQICFKHKQRLNYFKTWYKIIQSHVAARAKKLPNCVANCVSYLKVLKKYISNGISYSKVCHPFQTTTEHHKRFKNPNRQAHQITCLWKGFKINAITLKFNIRLERD